ncbi:unnamed protein product, partial [Ectocarpus sp. 12 AP-2014]
CFVCCLHASCAAVLRLSGDFRSAAWPSLNHLSLSYILSTSRHVIGGRTASTGLYPSKTSMFFFVLPAQHNCCPIDGIALAASAHAPAISPTCRLTLISTLNWSQNKLEVGA